MPLSVQLEDENGKRQGKPRWHADSTSLLVNEHPGTCCLRFIDPYGDTVFNQAQVPVLLAELRELRAALRDPEQAAVLDELCGFIERAADQVHMYLRFLGD